MKKGEILLKWEEVREMYPDQFVKVEVIESHMENEKEYAIQLEKE